MSDYTTNIKVRRQLRRQLVSASVCVCLRAVLACTEVLQDAMNLRCIFKSTDTHMPYNTFWLCQTLLVASMRAPGITGLAAPLHSTSE